MLERSEAIGRPTLIATVLQGLGSALAYSGQHDRGRQLLLRSLDVARLIGSTNLAFDDRVELIRLECSVGDSDAIIGHLQPFVDAGEHQRLGATDRRHMMRYAAAVLGAAGLDDRVDEEIAALRVRIIQAVGETVYDDAVAIGHDKGIAGASNGWYHLGPW